MNYEIKTDARCVVIGYGSWATALVKILHENEPKVGWYISNGTVRESVREHGINPTYLSDVRFDTGKLDVYDDINEAVASADVVLLCVPSAYLLPMIAPLTVSLEGKFVLSAIKGIIPGDYITVAEYVNRRYGVGFDRIGILCGPSHSEEVALGRLTYITMVCKHTENAEVLCRKFRSGYIHANPATDIYGTEYAEILKNIYAICAGMANGIFTNTQFTITHLDTPNSGYMTIWAKGDAGKTMPIYLPTAGYRFGETGGVYNRSFGLYWSSASTVQSGFILYVRYGSSQTGYVDTAGKLNALSLRCVRTLLPTLPTGSTLSRGFLLYFDGTGDNARLLLSEYDTGNPAANNTTNDHEKVLNKDSYRTKMAFFKFGSVIGISHSGKNYGAIDGAFELSDIKFNPSQLVIGQDNSGGINIYGTDSDMTAANTPPAVPGYLPSHYNANIRDLTSATYHTEANLKVGRGDPCQLVGLTAGEIKAALTNGTFADLIAARDANPQYKGWKTPSNAQNTGNFVGSDANQTPSSNYYGWTAGGGVDNPGIGLIKQKNVYLPAAGNRYNGGGYVNNQGSNGDYWSSTPNNATNGYYLAFHSSYLYPAIMNPYAYGFGVRCVRP